jgi:hypothetical protein
MIKEGCPHGPKEVVGDNCLECIKDKLSNEEINKQFDERLKEVVGRVPPCPSCAEKDAALCRAREALGGPGAERSRVDATLFDGGFNAGVRSCRERLKEALSSTGPCRHEGEAKRLRGELNRVEHLYRNRESLTMSDFAALVEDIFLHRRKAGREG